MANNLMHSDPFGDIGRFDPFRNIDELLQDLRTSPVVRGQSVSRIRMDVAETDQAYIVKANVPGVTKDDIKVGVDGKQVSINAEVKKIGEEDSGALVLSERYSGPLYRKFLLPQEVDDAQAEARYQDGVLELTLPKKMGVGGKQLTIQ